MAGQLLSIFPFSVADKTFVKYVCIAYYGNLIAACWSRETHKKSDILNGDQNT